MKTRVSLKYFATDCRKFIQLASSNSQSSSGRTTVSSYLKEGFESEKKKEKQTGERKQIQEENRKEADCRSYYI